MEVGGEYKRSRGCKLRRRKWRETLHASDGGAPHGPVDLLHELAATFRFDFVILSVLRIDESSRNMKPS